MDSSDLLLNFVAAPVRLYLKGRKDTVRCVVSALTEGKGSELHGELRKGGSLEYGPDEDDEDGGPGENWEPRRRNPDLAEAGSRGLDVLALLVSIYGSTDLFVSDYRSVLADKLLMTNLDCRADQELVTLELLKIRFGEEALHCCEVMLRDLEESRRTNATLLQQQQRQQQQRQQQQQRGADEEEDEVPFDCLIVSEHYWPALQSDPLTLPPRIAKSVASYQSAYATAKKPRKLHVAPQLGLVDIDLEFDDGSVHNFLVTPVQASLAMFLAEEGGGGVALLTGEGVDAQCCICFDTVTATGTTTACDEQSQACVTSTKVLAYQYKSTLLLVQKYKY
jgi:anaphase-promoting complex subunit 2